MNRWSRRLLPLLALGALVAAAALYGTASASPGAPSLAQPVTIEVRATDGWVNSGIDLIAGEPVNVTATGIVDCGARGCASDPDGVQPDTGQQWGSYSGGFLVPNAPQASLFAKVGGGAPVFVGRGPTTVSGSGRLYFAYNDNYYPDNHGAYTVTVSPTTLGANLNSCQAIRNANPAAGDGQYAVRVNGREIPVYCYGMASGAPRAYLSLPATDSAGPNASYTPGIAGSATATTVYTKAAIDLAGLKLDRYDPTFASTTFSPPYAGSFDWPGGAQTFVPLATAEDCQAIGSHLGTAHINLRSTPFGIANTFMLSGWGPAGTTSIYPAYANQVADLTGGGACGANAPPGVLGIDLLPQEGLSLTWLGPTVTAQVSAPPNSGAWYNSAGPGSVTVSFQCAAGDPAFPVTTCPAPVTVSREGANQLITGLAGDLGGTKAYASVGLNIDQTAPATHISGVPAGWSSQPVAISLSATDNVSGVAATFYSLDGAPTQTGNALTVAADGTHTLAYWSVDAAGNVEGQQSVTFQIDRTAPTISGSTSGAPVGDWYKADVTVSFTCDDATSGIATCSGPTTLHEGQGQSVTGTAADHAGNTASATISGINIDVTAPATHISGVPAGWVNQPVALTLTATDNLAQVAATYYSVDGAAAQTGTAITIAAEGSHSVTYWSVDKAGNEEEHHTATVQIDTTKPDIAGNADRAPNAHGWYNGDVTVSFTCSDPVSSGVASNIAACSSPTTLTTEAAGLSVTGTATDNAGNSATVTVSDINIDKTAPTIDITLGGELRNGAYVNTATPTVTTGDGLSGIDAARIVITLNGQPFTSGTPVTAPGSYTLAVAVADNAGNPAAATVQFKVRHTTALTYTGDVTGDYDDPATLSAVLTDTATTATDLGSQNISFSLGSQTCAAITLGNGTATCTITPNATAGTYPLAASYAGNDLYYPSSAAGNFMVNQEQTALHITSSATLDTSRVTVSAQLKEDGATPIAGRTVTFTAAGTDGIFTATGVTDGTGTATATFAIAPDQYSLSAAFAGDGYYLASRDQQTLYVYQPTRFVIWGGNPGGVPVGADLNFWGAQWTKQVSGKNQVTASFKGYADQVSGATWSWSTAPGGSSAPPAAVARYISVLVSTQITKSGSSISGNVVQTVVLRVDTAPAYSPDPSTPGFGVVMAVIQ